MSLINKSWLKTDRGELHRINDLTNFHIGHLPAGVIIDREGGIYRRLTVPALKASSRYTGKEVVIKSLGEDFSGSIEDISLIKEILNVPCRKIKKNAAEGAHV